MNIKVTTRCQTLTLLNSPRKFTVTYGISDFHRFVVFLVGPRTKSTSVNSGGFNSVGFTKTYSTCSYNFMNNVEISKD
jgi:hypothetical protein